jgi:hypothetical protein
MPRGDNCPASPLPIYCIQTYSLILSLRKKVKITVMTEEVHVHNTFCPISPGNPFGPCNFQQKT